jgi:ribosomal protein S21
MWRDGRNTATIAMAQSTRRNDTSNFIRRSNATNELWEVIEMSALEVQRREGESDEGLLSRFTKMVQRDGILREAKSRRHFLSNGELARIALKKALRRKSRRERMQRARR